VFSKAADVDRLLNMLKETDPAHDNLADNEEIQVCIRNCHQGCGTETLRRSCIGPVWPLDRRS
jgi:hypothetical protein